MIIGSLQRNQVEQLMSENAVAITMDMDWASDEVIEYSVNYFKSVGIPLTLFVTNESKYISSIAGDEDIELGIHPNFIKGSSQGEKDSEIIEFCKTLAPDSIGTRSHRYFDSNDVNDLLTEYGYQYDSNLCTLLDPLPPFIHRSGMIRFPIFLEDGAYLMHKQSLNFNKIRERFFADNCLRVINIHPMHMFINSPTIGYSRTTKDSLSRQEMNSLNFDERDRMKHHGVGIENFLKQMIDELKERKLKFYKLGELYQLVK